MRSVLECVGLMRSVLDCRFDDVSRVFAAIHRCVSAVLLLGNMQFKQERNTDQASLPDNTSMYTLNYTLHDTLCTTHNTTQHTTLYDMGELVIVYICTLPYVLFYVYVYIHACILLNVYICYTCLCVLICTYNCVHMCIMYVYACTCEFVPVYIYIHRCTLAHVHVCNCTRIYLYVYTYVQLCMLFIWKHL